MFKFFQNLGRSLMLPVAVLPAGAIITGIGNLLNALHILPTVAMFFSIVGTAILGQLGLIFAIGVAIGMGWCRCFGRCVRICHGNESIKSRKCGYVI